MVIGDNNLFEVACRIEASSIGSNNTFEPKCRILHNVSVTSHCHIGAGCVVFPAGTNPYDPAEKEPDDISSPPPSSDPSAATESLLGYHVPDSAGAIDSDPAAPNEAINGGEKKRVKKPNSSGKEGTRVNIQLTETLPPRTAVYGQGPDVKRRIWTGEGGGQWGALHWKHLEYLRETIPKYNRLKTSTGAGEGKK